MIQYQSREKRYTNMRIKIVLFFVFCFLLHSVSASDAIREQYMQLRKRANTELSTAKMTYQLPQKVNIQDHSIGYFLDEGFKVGIDFSNDNTILDIFSIIKLDQANYGDKLFTAVIIISATQQGSEQLEVGKRYFKLLSESIEKSKQNKSSVSGSFIYKSRHYGLMYQYDEKIITLFSTPVE